MARKNRNNPYYKYVPTVSIRRIIHHVLAFVMTILVFMMATALSTVTGFLNDSGVKKALENQEFYKSVRENIIEQCQSMAIPSMIDEDIFYSVFTKEKIASDVKAYLANSTKGLEYAFDLDDLQSTMEATIIENLKANDISVTAQTEKDVTEFCEQALQLYQSNITIKYIENYTELKGTVTPIAFIVFVVALIMVVALLFLMIAMYKFKVVHKTIRMFAYALGGSGMMLTGLSVYGKIVKIGSGLQLIPQYIYDAMHRYIQNGLNTFVFAGVILMIFSLSLAFVSEALRVRVKRNYFARLEANFRESLNEELENKNFTPDLDMTSREEHAKQIAHDEFNRYAMDKLSSVTLNEEREKVEADFDLPIVNPAKQDDFTEVTVKKDDEE